MQQSPPMGPEPLHAGDAGSGPPVLLVHGQPGLGTDWEWVVERLLADHRVITPDRPGYGESGPRALSMGDNAEALAGLLVERRAAPAVVVGHSYGGGIAALLAARHPELVRGLVLLGSVGPAGSVSSFDHLLATPALGEAITAAGLFTVGRLLPRLRPLGHLLPGEVADRLRAGLPDRRYAASVTRLGLRMVRTFLAEQRFLLEELGDVERALPDIAVPTVVMTGAWDVIVPPEVAADIAAAIHGAELVTVARTGHFLARDVPEHVARAVRRVGIEAA